MTNAPPASLGYEARLLPATGAVLPVEPTSWFITHGLGGPAAGTYTEVMIDRGSLDALTLEGTLEVAEILEDITRLVAVELYGTAWAFLYRPEQYADAIARYGLRRRERVLVSGIEVYS